MKNILLLFIPFFLITGCQKQDNDVPSPSYPLYPTVEDFFDQTGCKPSDTDLIRSWRLLVDENTQNRYLYGSKEKNGKENFWFAKYNSSGEQLWETIKIEDDYKNHAFNAKILSTGNIIVMDIRMSSDIDIKETCPVIINSNNGKTNFIKILEGFYGSDIYIYDRFFICSISQDALNLIPNAKPWHVQISNEGEILSQSDYFKVPEGKTIWPTDTTYICMNTKKIEKGYIYKKMPVWRYDVSIPQYKNCDMEISLNTDKILASYYLTFDNSTKDTITYKISYITGKDFKKVEGVILDQKDSQITVNNEIHLIASILPEEASNTNLIWESSNPTIATVDKNGMVKGISKGECLITVTTQEGNFSASCKITVKGLEDVCGVYFEETEVKILLGKFIQLKPIVVPETAHNKRIRWSSSNPAIASINPSGVVIGNSRGKAIITATTEEGGYEATCEVFVADVQDFISLNFSATITSFFNGYVTGVVYSQITNNSTEFIKITNLKVIDTSTNRIVAIADQSLLGNLSPFHSLNIGGPLNMIYYPMFVWEYEYNNRIYSISHTFLNESYKSIKRGSSRTNQLTWINE